MPLNILPVQNLENNEIEEVLASFVGEFEQEIPRFSAKKIKGKKMYELARKGVKMPKQTKMVEITEIELLNPSDDKAGLQGSTL